MLKFYTDVFLQSVVDDVLERHRDVSLFSVLYDKNFETLFYKLRFLK